jgi:4-aminobutyrate--pyruvate transaminase
MGDTMAFCPPLVITDNQIHEMFDKFEKALDETLTWVRAA